MKVCVLNGSPKGRDSVTMQYVRFIELANPDHTFVIEDVGQKITILEKDEREFTRVISSVASADAILFATPVYVMLVPAQFKRFIELVFSRNAAGDFSGKYAASLTTSIHFFDHTANAYLHAITEDLGMHWAGSFMAHMNDLLDEKNQENLALFAADFFDTVARKPEVQRSYPPITGTTSPYRPGPIPVPFDANGKSVIILTDATPGSNLEKMVTRAASCFGRSASIVHLDEIGMKGGCLGCCRCAFDNRCIYADSFTDFWKKNILTADILILAGTVKDRYFSALFKQAFDRSFFLGHVPSLRGKPIGILAEGPFSQCSTLRETLDAEVALQGAILAGIVTDEGENSAVIDERIDALSDRCIRLLRSGYIAPGGFPVVAGHKIFRDDIWGGMWPIFQADNTYYKKHGLYDFPQNNYAKRLQSRVLSLMLKLPPVRRSAEREMKKHMIEPFANVFSTSPVLKKIQKEKKV